MFGRNRIRLVSILLVASLAACAGLDPASPTAAAPLPTTITTEAASTYRADNAAPVSALDGFLTAEIDGDFEASFRQLSQADQEAAGGPEGWIAEHHFILPLIRGFRLISDTADGARAEVVADLNLQADLDQVVGLVPGEAASTWVLVEEAEQWRVGFTESRIEPVYLDDATAPAAVQYWAGRRQLCELTTDWDSSLLGFPSLAEALCGSSGPLHAGVPVPLSDAAESAPFLAAFGPEVGVWARVVSVDGANPLRAVVAPIGQDWVVIGVLEA